MKGRTIILVSHHVQLCAPGAAYVVALDNGRASYIGNVEGFRSSGVMATLVQSLNVASDDKAAEVQEQTVEELPPTSKSETNSIIGTVDSETAGPSSETSSTAAPSEVESKAEKKAPRKLIEEEKRAVGRIGREIWKTYLHACGGKFYWSIFAFAVLVAAMSPVLENGWLRFVASRALFFRFSHFVKLASGPELHKDRRTIDLRFSTFPFMP